MKKAFTITELLVAVGLLAVVLAAAGMVFNYSIDAQRMASATADIMRTLRAITGQINIDFEGLRTDGYLVLRSESDGNNFDALYFFSTGDFQSWHDSDRRSNIARIFLGHDRTTFTSRGLQGNLARDAHLLTPGYRGLDYNDANFAACQVDIKNELKEDPNLVLSTDRPDTNSTPDANNVRSLFAQNVGSLKIEWTTDKSSWIEPNQIEWFGRDNRNGGAFENPTADPYYLAYWSPLNQPEWPKALKFTFTLYDSKGILKGGRRFEHIVYIGQ